MSSASDNTVKEGLPVKGYQPQEQYRIDMVNANKEQEERLLRELDALLDWTSMNPRWVAIARSHFEQGFMAYNRAIFNPTRIKLPEDPQP